MGLSLFRVQAKKKQKADKRKAPASESKANRKQTSGQRKITELNQKKDHDEKDKRLYEQIEKYKGTRRPLLLFLLSQKKPNLKTGGWKSKTEKK
jgi:hypothetical protein